MNVPAPLRREARQFVILSRDSVHRLLNAAVHARDADPMQFAIWVAALAATPPAMYAFRMIFIYAGAPRATSFAVVEAFAISNRLFFIVYAMIASALLAALVWEALLPDRSDQEIVGVLPVRSRTVAAARLAAATSVAVAFALAIAVPSGLLFSVASSAAFGWLAIPTLFAAHVISITLACLVVFMSLLVVRGALALLAGPGAATSLATILQLVTVVTLVEVFIYLPSLLPAVVTRILPERSCDDALAAGVVRRAVLVDGRDRPRGARSRHEARHPVHADVCRPGRRRVSRSGRFSGTTDAGNARS